MHYNVNTSFCSAGIENSKLDYSMQILCTLTELMFTK